MKSLTVWLSLALNWVLGILLPQPSTQLVSRILVTTLARSAFTVTVVSCGGFPASTDFTNNCVAPDTQGSVVVSDFYETSAVRFPRKRKEQS